MFKCTLVLIGSLLIIGCASNKTTTCDVEVCNVRYVTDFSNHMSDIPVKREYCYNASLPISDANRTTPYVVPNVEGTNYIKTKNKCE